MAYSPSQHSAFRLLQTTKLSGLDIEVQHYEHLATGLHHYHLAADNHENALMIGFATQPMTSRGEAHILEHVVLCGSQKYPVRDPFFSMIKRSLQTFMNAMTASDWTVYPFATQNTKDYFNLMDVYLDAVFFPNIHPLDFAQEGIRVELDGDGKPHYHGIVFNEMKGAMSGEIEQLYYALAPHIFDASTYHYNSGGDPACIPHLTHEALVAFHQKYYHPSNAVMMSFGDIAVDDIHDKLQSFLGRFDDKERPQYAQRFFVTPEKRHTAPIKVQDTYTSDNEGDKMTHQVIAWLLPAITDPKLRLALRLMEGVLIEHSGLPLRQYLETTSLGQAPSPLLGLDDSHYEMVFYAGLRGSEVAHTDVFEQEILALLNEIASRPIDPEVIETILHQMELDQRHIGGDSMPYGLTLMLEGFSTAIHGGNPVDVWQVDEHLSWLKDNLSDPMWLPSLIKTHLLDNPHRVQLTLSPDSHKASRLIANEQTMLDQLDKTLSDNDKANIQKKTADLLARQAMIDDVELLPKVDLADIPKEIAFVHGKQDKLTAGGLTYPIYQYTVGTNGLYYYQLVMTMDDEALVKHPLMPLYLNLLSELGTHKYNAREFQAHQAKHGSGVTARISQRSHVHDTQKLSSYFVLATRALNHKTQAVEVLAEVLNDTIFSETERISELLKQRQMSWQSRLSGAGHAYAMQTASRGMSKQSAIEYAYSGLPALRALKAFLAQEDDNKWQVLSEALQALHAKILQLPKALILVCEEEARMPLYQAISQSLLTMQDVSSKQVAVDTPAPFEFVQLQDLLEDLLGNQKQADSAWLISTNVYHNACAYQTVPSGHPDAPALNVLAVYLRNGYLHSAIREKGGAYGGGASFDSANGAFRFYSYRDPHCAQTFAHFDKALDWLFDEVHEARQLEEAILGIIAGMDKPASPAGDAVKCCMSELHGRDETWQAQIRQAILAVTLTDLRRVAKLYLQDKVPVRATLAPVDQAEVLEKMGFVLQRLT